MYATGPYVSPCGLADSQRPFAWMRSRISPDASAGPHAFSLSSTGKCPHGAWPCTIRWQVGRESPWSLWDWRQYHARGLPDLHLVQRVLEVALVVGAFAAAVVPRHKSPLQLAALTAALLAGFELVLTYWLYTYIAWFFPFAAIAVLASAAVVRAEVHVEDPHVERPQLAPAH